MKVFNKKSIILLVCLILIVTVAAGTTVAILVDEGVILRNTFYPNDVNTEIEETLSGSVKSDVKIKNTGTTDAFIRARIAISWKDEKGNVYGTAPVMGTDYTMTLDLANGWKKASDGIYYYTESVEGGASTGVLIKTCSPVEGKAPEGYKLTVDILGSGIQSKPARAVTSQWSSGVASVSDNKLTVK